MLIDCNFISLFPPSFNGAEFHTMGRLGHSLLGSCPCVRASAALRKVSKLEAISWAKWMGNTSKPRMNPKWVSSVRKNLNPFFDRHLTEFLKATQKGLIVWLKNLFHFSASTCGITERSEAWFQWFSFKGRSRTLGPYLTLKDHHRVVKMVVL